MNSISVDKNARQRLILAEWLRSIFPGLNLPINACDEDLKACLLDANVLSQILNKLKKPGPKEAGYVIHNLASRAEKITRFLAAMADMGILKFDSTDIEDASMDSLYNCLWSIRARFMSNDGGDSPLACKSPAKSENITRFDTSLHDPFSPMSGEEKRKVLFESKFLRTLSSPVVSEPFGGSNHQVGHKFHEVFQLKQGRYADLPAAKISEMIKSNSLDNAPTQSLLSVVNGILDESVEKKNGEIPHRVACLLRKVVQEIERRISTQAEHLRTQNNLFKAREEKFQSRIRVLEALASNINEENQCVLSQLQQTKQAEKTKAEEKKNFANEDVTRLIKERDEYKAEIMLLKQELETAKKTYELRCLQVEMEKGEDVTRLIKERDESKVEITMLKQDLEIAKKTYELRCLQVKTEKGEDVSRLIKESDESKEKITMLKQELETTKKMYELHCSQVETEKGEDVSRLIKERDESKAEITMLKQGLETAKKTYELRCLQVEAERGEDVSRLIKERDESRAEIITLKQELETAKKTYELCRLQVEAEKGEDMTRLIKERDESREQIITLKQELETAKKTYELRCLQVEAERGEDVTRFIKERDESRAEIITLKQELETAKKTYELRCLQLETETSENVTRLIKEREEIKVEIVTLKQELETAKKTYELRCLQLETEKGEDVTRLTKERDESKAEIAMLKQELETTTKTYELHCLQVETEAESARLMLEERIKELEDLLEDSSNEVQELTTFFESKQKKWNAKVKSYKRMIEFQCNLLQGVRCSSESLKEEVLKVKLDYSNEVNQLGLKLKSVAHAAENYHVLLAENRKMFNELQDLKGNIRVYCRIRPFLTGQKDKRMTIEHIGENGEVVIANPTKPGKEGHKLFKFNKVYSPVSTQGEVFSDIQPLIRSVLDGYNVCIFAYGQTGSGKTYTMTGPNGATKENWGVNYRALNDLFEISQNRSGAISYDVGAQMVEIYNEQVRDLLSSNASQKKLGILTHSQPFGLAVPDATMLPVNATSDVIELMDIGLKNRAVGATAMNERSSRSHSIVTIHVRGTDLKGGSSLHGNLHLVDLAGSERVDRSEVTGDRLKEAQHINKSLSALGDVIFALAQKSSHVPYRNSKLTQVLQSSLGGQAKTVMFVQLNPDVNSYSESLSTLKFAERVSGIELGAARSSKEGRDVRELMDQVASLKDTISKRDEEIERLQLLKDIKNNVYNGIITEKRSATSMNKDVNGGVPRIQKPSGGKSIGGAVEKAGLDHDNVSDHSDVHSEADSHHSMDDMKKHNEVIQRLDIGQNIIEDAETLGFADADYEERLMDIPDDDLSLETENDATTESPNSNQATKTVEKLEKPRSATTVSRTLLKHTQTASTTLPGSKESSRISSAPSLRKTVTGLKSGRRWQ